MSTIAPASVSCSTADTRSAEPERRSDTSRRSPSAHQRARNPRALGATNVDIRRLVLGEGGRLVLVGIVIGAVATAGLSRLLTRFVFQISALAPAPFVMAPALLAASALVAMLIPARRAARVDPMRALRSERRSARRLGPTGRR
ncbi:MAG: FtsX-like permease family protein [Gemmatimonadaceae bacterium]